VCQIDICKAALWDLGARTNQNCQYLFLWALATDLFLFAPDLQQAPGDSLYRYNLLVAQDTRPNLFAIDWAKRVVDYFARAQAPKENQTPSSPLSMLSTRNNECDFVFVPVQLNLPVVRAETIWV
jgi:hypothetical protein